MSITKKSFGFMPDGREVFSYLLDNGKNLKAEILNYGGAVKNLWVKGKNGEYTDVVLGYDTLEEYFDNDAFFGVLVGRCGNRIKNGKFTINGKEYSVGINDGTHSLHGGISGFNKYLWDAKEIDGESPALCLSMLSPDGDEGYPGNLSVKVTYTLNENDALCIKYEAETDKDTIANLTNHSYFNLNGAGCGDICDMDMELSVSFYTPADEDCVTTGEIASVSKTPFDFRGGAKIGDALKTPHPQTALFGGFDNNFIIDGRGFRKAAALKSLRTKISMELYTDAPAMQIYTGNKIDTARICKDGKCYPTYGGICLETQNFPNAINYGHFPNPILKAGEKYEYIAEHRFITE